MNSYLRTTVLAGLIGGLAMIPPGAVFHGLGWRVNEYGRRTLGLVLSPDAPMGLRMLAMMSLHLVVSVAAAAPLTASLRATSGLSRAQRLGVGALYGTGFYVVVNSFVLPWLHGDASPWSLGPAAVLPSLVVHIVFGMVALEAGRRFAADRHGTS